MKVLFGTCLETIIGRYRFTKGPGNVKDLPAGYIHLPQYSRVSVQYAYSKYAVLITYAGVLSGKLKVDKPLPKYVFRDPALPRLASSWLCLGSIRTFYVYDA